MARTEPCNVFVYGTFKPTHANFERLCAGKVSAVSPGLAKGQLYQIPFYTETYTRGYPAMTLEKGWVKGYLFQCEETEILKQLDQLEDYEEGRSPAENEYQRQRLQIFTLDQKPLTTAWGYVMTLAKVQELEGIDLGTTAW